MSVAAENSSQTAARNTTKESNQNTQEQRTVSQTWVEKLVKKRSFEKMEKTTTGNVR